MRSGWWIVLVAASTLIAGAALAADRPLSPASGSAAANGVIVRDTMVRDAMTRGAPFPGSIRERAVRAELVCWSQCQRICTDGLDRCLNGEVGQGRCLAATDRCDRICQSDCRHGGGPLIEPIPR